jgi:type IV pilus assembly protein PilV
MPVRIRGFTMVEVLVALVVLSVGMLGIAGLYVITLRSGGSAIYRMQAVNLAADIAERIRANRSANVAYAGAAANNPCFGVVAVADCTPANMAAADLFVWQAQVAQTLPGGTGALQVVPTAVSIPPLGLVYSYQITINWTEAGASAQSYVVNFQI